MNQTPPPNVIMPGRFQQTPSSNDTPEQKNRSMIHYVPVTPMIVGKVMSRDDVYYAPQQGNPFPLRFRSAKLVDKGSCRSSLCTDDDENDTDRGILEDCTEFLELHSPQEQLAGSKFYQQPQPRHLPMACFPTVLPELISTPSSTSSFSRFNGRLQRSNSMPGSPSSLFERDSQKPSAVIHTTSNSVSSGQLKNNFGDFSSADTSFSRCSSEKLSGSQNNKLTSDVAELTSDVSEYGSSSMDSALGSEMTRGRLRRTCIMPPPSRRQEYVASTVIQRHHRVGSATVYRSSSTVYPQYEEAALLARYFEICRRDSLNSSQNSSFCNAGNEPSEDNDDLTSGSIYSCKLNTNNCYPMNRSSKESNVLASSSGIDSDVVWDERETASTDELSLGKRDDPNRKSRERFLELVRSWENSSASDQQTSRTDENGSKVSKDNVQKGGVGGGGGGQTKLMEFAEFYLFRRFQELKQKWEKRQQQGHASSKNAKSREGEETVRNSPEKSHENDLAT